MIPAAIAPKVAKLIPLLASDKDGEALGAARALGRTLHSGGVDFHALAAAVTPIADHRRATPAGDLEMWADLVRRARVFAPRLSARDRDFLRDMDELLRRGRMPSARQADWLSDIGDRILRWEGTP